METPESPFEGVNDEQFSEIYNQLLTYTDKKMRRLKGSRLYTLADHKDIAHEAIQRTLSGVRPWNKDRVSLFAHLAGSAKSIIYALSKSLDIKLSKEISQEEGDIHDKQPSSEEIQIYLEEAENLMKLVEENRVDLLGLLRVIIHEEISKPTDLSKRLLISVNEANYGKRTLKRLWKKMNRGEVK